MRLAALFVMVLLPLAAAVDVPGDAGNGAELFRTQKCIACHSVNGTGGSTAPDLGKRTARDLTPTQMAALLWNHGPAMWTAMDKAGIARPNVSSQQAADLFGYFYASRYFERPGDAGRGRKLFVDKSCAECHNITSSTPAGGKPVMQWASVANPIELARGMWNHAPRMSEAMSKAKKSWPSLTSQELTDMVVYLQNLPQTKNLKPAFSAASAETGAELFRLKGCVECHRGAQSLSRRAAPRTMTDFAAAMWNHAPRMLQSPPALRPEEMTRLVGYAWSQQFFDDIGDAARGKSIFNAKCASCHQSAGSGAPPIAGRITAFDMASMTWRHGAAMAAAMKQKNLAWPRFERSDMADLLAHVNAMSPARN